MAVDPAAAVQLASLLAKCSSQKQDLDTLQLQLSAKPMEVMAIVAEFSPLFNVTKVNSKIGVGLVNWPKICFKYGRPDLECDMVGCDRIHICMQLVQGACESDSCVYNHHLLGTDGSARTSSYTERNSILLHDLGIANWPSRALLHLMISVELNLPFGDNEPAERAQFRKLLQAIQILPGGSSVPRTPSPESNQGALRDHSYPVPLSVSGVKSTLMADQSSDRGQVSKIESPSPMEADVADVSSVAGGGGTIDLRDPAVTVPASSPGNDLIHKSGPGGDLLYAGAASHFGQLEKSELGDTNQVLKKQKKTTRRGLGLPHDADGVDRRKGEDKRFKPDDKFPNDDAGVIGRALGISPSPNEAKDTDLLTTRPDGASADIGRAGKSASSKAGEVTLQQKHHEVPDRRVAGAEVVTQPKPAVQKKRSANASQPSVAVGVGDEEGQVASEAATPAKRAQSVTSTGIAQPGSAKGFQATPSALQTSHGQMRATQASIPSVSADAHAIGAAVSAMDLTAKNASGNPQTTSHGQVRATQASVASASTGASQLGAAISAMDLAAKKATGNPLTTSHDQMRATQASVASASADAHAIGAAISAMDLSAKNASRRPTTTPQPAKTNVGYPQPSAVPVAGVGQPAASQAPSGIPPTQPASDPRMASTQPSFSGSSALGKLLSYGHVTTYVQPNGVMVREQVVVGPRSMSMAQPTPGPSTNPPPSSSGASRGTAVGAATATGPTPSTSSAPGNDKKWFTCICGFPGGHRLKGFLEHLLMLLAHARGSGHPPWVAEVGFNGCTFPFASRTFWEFAAATRGFPVSAFIGMPVEDTVKDQVTAYIMDGQEDFSRGVRGGKAAFLPTAHPVTNVTAASVEMYLRMLLHVASMRFCMRREVHLNGANLSAMGRQIDAHNWRLAQYEQLVGVTLVHGPTPSLQVSAQHAGQNFQAAVGSSNAHVTSSVPAVPAGQVKTTSDVSSVNAPVASGVNPGDLANAGTTAAANATVLVSSQPSTSGASGGPAMLQFSISGPMGTGQGLQPGGSSSSGNSASVQDPSRTGSTPHLPGKSTRSDVHGQQRPKISSREHGLKYGPWTNLTWHGPDRVHFPAPGHQQSTSSSGKNLVGSAAAFHAPLLRPAVLTMNNGPSQRPYPPPGFQSHYYSGASMPNTWTVVSQLPAIPTSTAPPSTVSGGAGPSSMTVDPSRRYQSREADFSAPAVNFAYTSFNWSLVDVDGNLREVFQVWVPALLRGLFDANGGTVPLPEVGAADLLLFAERYPESRISTLLENSPVASFVPGDGVVIIGNEKFDVKEGSRFGSIPDLPDDDERKTTSAWFFKKPDSPDWQLLAGSYNGMTFGLGPSRKLEAAMVTSSILGWLVVFRSFGLAGNVVNLDEMKMRSETGKEFDLKREVVEMIPKMKPHWIPMLAFGSTRSILKPVKLTLPFVQVDLDGKIPQTLRLSTKQGILDYRVNVIQVYMIQNPHRMKNFEDRAGEMAYIYQPYANEVHLDRKIMFHGTDPGAIAAICHDGFDWRRAGDSTGAKYGLGTYFSTRFGTSHPYAREVGAKHASPVQGPRRRFMFVADVLVGLKEKGTVNLRYPSIWKGDVNFDTAVEKLDNPEIFVKFDSSESYAKFLIEYEVAEMPASSNALPPV